MPNWVAMLSSDDDSVSNGVFVTPIAAEKSALFLSLPALCSPSVIVPSARPLSSTFFRSAWVCVAVFPRIDSRVSFAAWATALLNSASFSGDPASDARICATDFPAPSNLSAMSRIFAASASDGS